MIDRIEAGIGAVNRMKERKHVDAPERPGERSVEERLQVAERSAGQAIDIGDQLGLVPHPSCAAILPASSRAMLVYCPRVRSS